MAFKNHYTIVKDYTYNCLHYSYDRKWNELFVRKKPQVFITLSGQHFQTQ